MGKKVRECLCLRCGKEFTTTHPQKKYCSYECLWKAVSANKSREYTVKICKSCGRSFKGQANDRFCSIRCKSDYAALMQQKRKCKSCFYSTVVSSEVICNYMEITGHSRLCMEEAKIPCRLYEERRRNRDK